MRITVRRGEQLLKEAKAMAAQSGITLTRLVEDALRGALARRRTDVPGKRVILKTFKGGGVQPGVDLDDSASLLDLMDRPHAAR